MMKAKITEQEAIEIINKIRSSNSFTMGLTLDEYIDGFRKRYLKMFGKVLPNSYIEIAEIILELKEDRD